MGKRRQGREEVKQERGRRRAGGERGKVRLEVGGKRKVTF